jgi:hypothetical protein
LDPSKIHGATQQNFHNETVDLTTFPSDSAAWLFLKPMDELFLKSSETRGSEARQEKQGIYELIVLSKNYRQKC